jgi:DNA-directed RNA polymerase subunit beta
MILSTSTSNDRSDVFRKYSLHDSKETFLINGAERVVVSQLHRSPGVFFGQSVHPNGTKIYSARVIPFKGAWMEFATDINNVMYAYIDRKKKFPVTTLLRSIGWEYDKDILNLFGLSEEISAKKESLKKHLGRKLAARVLRAGRKISLMKIPVK